MKIIRRIFYALAVSVGMMLVYSLTDSHIKTLALEAAGREAIEQEEWTYFLPVRYYHSVPLLDQTEVQSGRQFRILLYEVAYVGPKSGETYPVTDGLAVLVFQESGEPLAEYFQVILTTDQETEITNLGYQILDFPLYSVLEEESTSPMFAASRFLKQDQEFADPVMMEFAQDGEIVFRLPLSLDLSAFSLKNELDSYLLTHSEPPVENEGTIAVVERLEIDSTWPVVRNLLLYAAGVTALTIFVFSYRRRRLGSKPPTPGLQTDLDRLKEPSVPKSE